ncbi:MAG: FtsX-like permease family protein [Oscillospiraceae bacterium]
MSELGRLTRRSLPRRRAWRTGTLSLALLYALCVLAVALQGSLLASRQELRSRTYGAWSGAVYDTPPSVAGILERQEEVACIGRIDLAGEINGLPAGSMDEGMLSLSRLQMLEGRLPEQSGEFAAEEYALARLGDPAVGETVIVRWDGVERRMTLTGIIRSWRQDWKTSGGVLPSVLVKTNAGAEISATHIFWYAASQPFLDELYDALEAEGGTYVYNEYGQASPEQDSILGSEEILFPIAAVALLVTLYELCLQLPEKRYRAKVLSGLGASRWQLVQLSLRQTGWALLAALLPGVLLGTALTALGLWGAEHFLHWPAVVSVNGEYLADGLGVVTAVFAIGQTVASYLLAEQPLSASMRKESSVLGGRRLPKLRGVRTLGFWGRLRRRQTFHRGRSVLRAGISLLVIAAVSVSLVRFVSSYREYRYVSEHTLYSYYVHVYRLEDGLSEEEIQRLKDIPGVVEVAANRVLQYPVFDMYGLDREAFRIHSPLFVGNAYIAGIRQYGDAERRGTPYRAENDYLPVSSLLAVSTENTELLRKYEALLEEGTLDLESFHAGESCLLILAPYMIDYREIDNARLQLRSLSPGEEPPPGTAVYRYGDGENDLQSGDSVTVESPWGISADLEVAGVIRSEDFYIDDLEASNAFFAMVVSENLLPKLTTENVEDRCNDILIYSYRDADHEKTDWLVESALSEKYPDLQNIGGETCHYQNNRLVFEDNRQYLLSEMFWSAACTAVILLLFTLLLFGGAMSELEERKKQMGIYQSLGMTERRLRWEYTAETAIDALLTGGVAFAGMMLWWTYRLWKQVGFRSWEEMAEAFRAGSERTGTNTYYVSCTLFAVAVLWAVLFFVTYLPLLQSSRCSVLQRLREEE